MVKKLGLVLSHTYTQISIAYASLQLNKSPPEAEKYYSRHEPSSCIFDLNIFLEKCPTRFYCLCVKAKSVVL